MIADVSPIVRHESVVALSSIGDDAIIPELEKAIGDRDEDVSNSALIAFEYLTYLKRKRQGSPETVKPRIRPWEVSCYSIFGSILALDLD